MNHLKSILIVLLVSMSVCCFGQDCLLADEAREEKPIEEGKCYEYTYISDHYEIVKEIEVRKAPNVPEEIELYEEYVIAKRKLVKKGYCDWVEIICEENETPELYRQIKLVLKERQFYKNYPLNSFKTKKMMEDLEQLQRGYYLPIGNLNIETMKALGIDYEALDSEK
ncbi:MAG: hypothetical protein ACPGVB_07220 [Chitinophagales bacterium]